MLDPRVDAAVWPEHLRTADRAADLAGDFARHWERWGFGPWTVRQDGAVIGYVGLRHGRVAGRPELELLWFLDASHWNQGLATEMGAAAVRVAHEELELDDLVALAHVRNGASRRVMEKLGMVAERELEHAGLPHVLYRLRTSA